MKIKEQKDGHFKVGIMALFAHNELFFQMGEKKQGGAEKRTILLAEMLKELGYSVEIVLATPPWYCPKLKKGKGFNVHYHKRYQKGGSFTVRKVYSSNLYSRFLDKIRLTIGRQTRDIDEVNRRLFFADFDRIEADVWLTLSVNDTAAHLADYCFHNNKPLILGLAHDLDLDFILTPNGTDVYGANREGKRLSLSRANSVLVQNKFQQEQVMQAFPSKPVYFLRNPIKNKSVQSPKSNREKRVVWVGKFHRNKNPAGLLRVAELLPEITFTMICNKGQKNIEAEIKKRRPSNVELIDYVPSNKMGFWYQNSTLHLSTAIQEGFPNSFLEAALFELPTLSLHVDPDGLMKNGVLGECYYGDEQALVLGIQRLLNHPEVRTAQGKKARDYVIKHHAYPKIKEELALAMKEIADQIDKEKTG